MDTLLLKKSGAGGPKCRTQEAAGRDMWPGSWTREEQETSGGRPGGWTEVEQEASGGLPGDWCDGRTGRQDRWLEPP